MLLNQGRGSVFNRLDIESMTKIRVGTAFAHMVERDCIVMTGGLY